MKQAQFSSNSTQGHVAEKRVRVSLVVAVAGAGLVCTALLVTHRGSSGDNARPDLAGQATGDSFPSISASVPRDLSRDQSSAESSIPPAASLMPPARAEARPAPTVPARVAPASPSADPRLLVKGIWSVDPNAGPITAERAALWKWNLQQLIQSGTAAVPAIAEALSGNQEIMFSTEDSNLLGYGSARGALFEALAKIGNSEGRDALGDYRESILAAARSALQMAPKGEYPESDLGGVFDVVRKCGDSSVVADLESARLQWSHYASIALAGLPDGQGIPSLLEVAQSESQPKTATYLFTFQLLAQAAGSQDSAALGLMDLVQANKVPVQAWPLMAQGLLAENYQYGKPTSANLSGYTTASVQNGKQSYYSPPLRASQNPDALQRRLRFIDQVLATTTDPAAMAALGQARAKLTGQLRAP